MNAPSRERTAAQGEKACGLIGDEQDGTAYGHGCLAE
jgi:hypothetical protein